MSKLMDQVIISAAVAFTGLTLTTLPALAQGGTAEQRNACMADAMTYCASAIPNEGRIETCLRRQSAQLSLACRMVLDASATVEKVATRPRRSVNEQ